MLLHVCRVTLTCTQRIYISRLHLLFCRNSLTVPTDQFNVALVLLNDAKCTYKSIG